MHNAVPWTIYLGSLEQAEAVNVPVLEGGAPYGMWLAPEAMAQDPPRTSSVLARVLEESNRAYLRVVHRGS